MIKHNVYCKELKLYVNNVLDDEADGELQLNLNLLVM